jgi:hypothetical protein
LPEQHADATEQPFDVTTVSSLAEILAENTGGLTFVPPAHLPLWLPDLAVPLGWDFGALDGPPVTRMLLRRLGGSNRWDGCEVLNLYRVSGAVPEKLVLDNADRTLRDIGANAIQTHRIDAPSRYGLVAARSSGRLDIGANTINSQYSYYVVNTAAGAALIEQAVIVRESVRPLLNGEVAGLSEDLYRALLASIDRAPAPPSPSPSPQNIGRGVAGLRPEPMPLPSKKIPSGPSETGSKWRAMSTIRVNFLPEFYYGDDAVLLTLDGGGVDELKNTLGDAQRRGSSRLEHDGVTHEFRIEPGSADIELDRTHVVWRLDHVKATEIIGDLTVLSGKGGVVGPTSGHFYVDMSTPAETLVVSRDEYVDVIYPWQPPT